MLKLVVDNSKQMTAIKNEDRAARVLPWVIFFMIAMVGSLVSLTPLVLHYNDTPIDPRSLMVMMWAGFFGWIFALAIIIKKLAWEISK